MNLFKLSDSPFLKDKNHPQVRVAAGKGAYQNTIDALSHFDLSPAKGKTVLLKPNAGRIAEPNSGICTDPQVVAAAIDAFREAGADVHIGESPISGVKALEALDSTGIAKIANERNCPLIDMDARKPVIVPIPDGKAIKSLKLCPEVTEFDIIVSIPVMKMHMHTGATIAVKNMKGCLWRRSKVVLHMLPPMNDPDADPQHTEKPLDIAIADMSAILKPHLSIVDGITGLEGLGPSAGTKKELNVVVVSADAFAADAVSCRLMGTSAAEIPHLRIGGERGTGIIDLDKIDVTPENWTDYADAFAKPPSDLSVEFPDINIMDNNSCSACQSTLLLFLKRYKDELKEYLPGDTNIAIGAGHDEMPIGSLCIGNCIKKEFRDSGIFIPGCPPVGSEILSAVTGEPSVDVRDGHSSKKKS
jgi:uncharacterized protein (DUF362 family)